MEDKKKNKGFTPGESDPHPSPLPSGRGGGMVWIKFRQGRGAEGVRVNEDGTALVDAKTAQYLISIGYAFEIEKE